MAIIEDHAEKLLKNAHILLDDFFTQLNLQQQYSVSTIAHNALLLAETLVDMSLDKSAIAQDMIITKANDLLTPILGYTHLLTSSKLGILGTETKLISERLLHHAEVLREEFYTLTHNEVYYSNV